ncbi:hypothetical protein NZK33_17205 [Cyanobium sp. FGCU-6]|jgi:hypothetical protein|nr:hypothetical protein [Cyanobium sp. FGCU6]
MGGPSLPRQARILTCLLLLGCAATCPGLSPPVRAQEAMVQWRQQIQSSFGSGSNPSPAPSAPLAPVTVPASAVAPEAPPSGTNAGATGAASSPTPPSADGTCPPLRVSQIARIQAGRTVRLRGGDCLMEFN